MDIIKTQSKFLCKRCLFISPSFVPRQGWQKRLLKRNSCLYFVLRPADEHPKSPKLFLDMIRYVGRGNDRQVETHGQNAVVRYFYPKSI